MSLDNFFLTAPFATDELKSQVETAKNKLQGLQSDISTANIQLSDVIADLSMMEEKTDFLVQEIRKTLVIASVPEEIKPDQAYEILKSEVYDPLSLVSTASFAASGLFVTIGFLGSRKAIKAGQTATKTLGATRSGKKIAQLSKLSKASKASKFTKLMKVGNKLGAIGLGLAAVELGLRMKNAVEMNYYFKQNLGEIKGYISDDNKTLALLKESVKEARSLRTELLEQAELDPKDSTSIEKYMRQLSEDIAAVAKDSAYLKTARRMLSMGMSVEYIKDIVPELSPVAISMLAQKTTAEQALLKGQTIEEVAIKTSLTIFQIKYLQKLFDARMALLKGDSVDQVMLSFKLLDDVVEGIEETLFNDRRSAWSLLAGDSTLETIAQSTSFPIETILYFKNTIKCKLMIEAGKLDSDIIAQLGTEDPFITVCRDFLPQQKQHALEIIRQLTSNPVEIRPIQIAADLLLPTEIVNTLIKSTE